MYRIFFLILFLLLNFCNFLKAQDIFTIERENIHPISDINWKTFKPAELDNIYKSSLSKEIIILSESDHGHGSSLDAQCAILKMLIDSSKIHSLYLESNWINCDRIMEILKAKGEAGIQDAKKFIRTVELKYWTVTGFWEYLAGKIASGKLKLKGFDISGLSPTIANELFNEAIELPSVKDFASQHIKEYKLVKWCFDYFEGWNTGSVMQDKEYWEINVFINAIIDSYTARKNLYRVKEWRSILNYFYWMLKRGEPLQGNKYSNEIKTDKQFSIFYSVRDSLMADLFLKEYSEDSNDKVACSMAAYHAMRNSKIIEKMDDCCKDNNIMTMGEIIDKKLPNKIYNICFVAASGSYGVEDLGPAPESKIKKPVIGSLEYTLNKMNFPYCFVNLCDMKSAAGPFFMNAVFNRFLKSEWKDNFSGVLFIKEMKPLVLISLSTN